MSEYKKYLMRQLGLKEPSKKKIIKENGIALSPTAIPTPIIGVAVRGSVTGGLPSGADQLAKDITPTNLGGYDKIDAKRPNSLLVGTTPSNPEILTTNPIAPTSTTINNPHPHQVQNDPNEPPQAVTGASTDGDQNHIIKPKSSLSPQTMDIDIAEQDKTNKYEPIVVEKPDATSPNKEGYGPTSMNETFARHLKLMKEKLGLNECEECGCEDKEKKTDECHEDKKVGASHPFTTKWKMDKEKSGMVKVDEDKESKKEQSVWDRMSPTQKAIFKSKDREDAAKQAEKSKKITEKKALDSKGDLHKDLGIPKKQEIPTEKLKVIKDKLSKKAKKSPLSKKELELSRRVNSALNMRKKNK